MPVPTEVQIGSQLALTLAALYLPGSQQTISALGAILHSVNAYNAARGNDPDYVPSHEELQAFIADRESRRIDIPDNPAAPPSPGD